MNGTDMLVSHRSMLSRTIDKKPPSATFCDSCEGIYQLFRQVSRPVEDPALPYPHKKTQAFSCSRMPSPTKLTIKEKAAIGDFFFYGLPGRIRTCDLESRSLTRYPAVPRAEMFWS